MKYKFSKWSVIIYNDIVLCQHKRAMHYKLGRDNSSMDHQKSGEENLLTITQKLGQIIEN
jgi:hypothetical protein